MEEHVSSDKFEAEEKPSKKSKKGGAKGSVALLNESAQLGCVFQDSYPTKSVIREDGKLGSKHAVKISKGTWYQKKTGKKESIAGNYPHALVEDRGICRTYIQAQECGQNCVLLSY